MEFICEVNDGSLLVQVGALEFVSTNGDAAEGGSFMLRVPLWRHGLVHISWDSELGLDWYCLSEEEAQVLRYTQQRVRELMAEPDSWWHAEEPSNAELEVMEALMAAGVFEELE